jgi:hypothetical protein
MLQEFWQERQHKTKSASEQRSHFAHPNKAGRVAVVGSLLSGWSVLCLMCALCWATGCKTTGWGQVKPTIEDMGLLGGARLRVLRTFVDTTMFCGVFELDNRRGESKVYINPHRIQFVGKQIGKNKHIGTWSMKRTEVAREETFRAMVRDYHKISPQQRIGYWGKFYFPMGEIRPKQRAEGFLCFQLARDEKDPERIVLTERSRMRLMDVLIDGGVTPLDWFYFEPVK